MTVPLPPLNAALLTDEPNAPLPTIANSAEAAIDASARRLSLRRRRILFLADIRPPDRPRNERSEPPCPQLVSVRRLPRAHVRVCGEGSPRAGPDGRVAQLPGVVNGPSGLSWRSVR